MPDNVENPTPSEIKEESNHVDSEDTDMSDVEDPPIQTPLSPPESQPTSTQNTNPKKGPSPSSHGPTSRKTQSATKPDQVPSGRILKNSRNKKRCPKEKVFTEEQTKALLDAASTGCPPTGPATLRRSERLKVKAAASKRRMCT